MDYYEIILTPKLELVTKEYEPFIVDLIKKNTLPNKDAINIGANIGLFTNLLASLIDNNKNVLSIEPTPNALKYLEENNRLNNNSEKIIIYKGIASNKSGAFSINVIQGNEEYSSIGEIAHNSVKNKKSEKLMVNSDTIDNLVEKYHLNPSIIVIDVEGAELQVLSGATKTIKLYKPIIISELDDSLLIKLHSTSNEIVSLLENFGYIVENIENNKLVYPFSGNIIAKPLEAV